MLQISVNSERIPFLRLLHRCPKCRTSRMLIWVATLATLVRASSSTSENKEDQDPKLVANIAVFKDLMRLQVVMITVILRAS